MVFLKDKNPKSCEDKCFNFLRCIIFNSLLPNKISSRYSANRKDETNAYRFTLLVLILISQAGKINDNIKYLNHAIDADIQNLIPND